jgi:hypothetical protein
VATGAPLLSAKIHRSAQLFMADLFVFACNQHFENPIPPGPAVFVVHLGRQPTKTVDRRNGEERSPKEDGRLRVRGR